VSPSDWSNVERVLATIIDLPKNERTARIVQLCRDNPELRAEVESLLAAHESADSFMEAAPQITPGQDSEFSMAGKHLGPYLLLERIGSGGMGTVYRAERIDGRFQKQVAIKVVPAALHSKELLRRFTSEQNILASLEHPTIARLLDAGVSPEGIPYFVMEHVDGVPLDDFLKANQLTVFERLKLFQVICSAVQYAHQHLIVHRDLKPANILVTGDRAPRLLDFGIAKIVDPWSLGAMDATRSLLHPMTPSYASPEQVRGETLTTATDIYSLGVILFEMLAGRMPYKIGNNLQEIARTIQQEDAEPLGTVNRAFRGDIETIVAKALDKEKSRRYSSAADLAADIQRFLQHEPINARRPTPIYQLQKFTARHKAVVGGVTAVFFVLIVGIAATAWEAKRARQAEHSAVRERDQANRVTELMTSMFRVSDPSEARGNSVTAREILDKASKDIDGGLTSDPRLQAQMMHVMGTVYEGLGLYSRAESLFSRATEIRSHILGKENPDTLTSRRMLAWTLREEGHYPESEKLHRETLEIQRRVLGLENPDTLASMHMLAWTLREEGQSSEAEKMLRQALELQRKVLGPENKDTLQSQQMLAWTLRDEGENSETEKLLRDALRIQTRVLGPEDPDTLASMHMLGWTLREEGLYAESEKFHRETLNIRRRILGPEHPDTLASMNQLAGTLLQEGKYADAGDMLREILDIQRRVLGPDNPETAISRYNLACVAAHRGRGDEALRFLKDAIDHGLPPNARLGMEKDPDLKLLHEDSRFKDLAAYAKQHVRQVP
jgi:eukaryotic-like serine/threonine-protein kinase